MKKAFLASLPDVLDAKDVSKVLGVGYVKALRLIPEVSLLATYGTV